MLNLPLPLTMWLWDFTGFWLRIKQWRTLWKYETFRFHHLWTQDQKHWAHPPPENIWLWDFTSFGLRIKNAKPTPENMGLWDFSHDSLWKYGTLGFHHFWTRDKKCRPHPKYGRIRIKNVNPENMRLSDFTSFGTPDLGLRNTEPTPWIYVPFWDFTTLLPWTYGTFGLRIKKMLTPPKNIGLRINHHLLEGPSKIWDFGISPVLDSG